MQGSIMGQSLTTRASLLVRLGDPKDRAAWQQFVELYGSLVYGFARKRGLQDADAADLTQEVFAAIAQTVGRWKYDARKGSFRHWLYGVTRHKIARFLQVRRRQPVGSGGPDGQEILNEQPSQERTLEESWEQEFQHHQFRLAAAQVKESFAPTTWLAFWQTAVEGRSPAAVAAELQLSVGNVYVARSRVLARLTQQIQQMNEEG